MIMKTIQLSVLCGIVLLAGVHHSAAETNVVERIPERLNSVTNQIHALAPSAVVAVTNGELNIVQGQPKEYTSIVDKDMRGKALKKPGTIRFKGPDEHGFTIQIRWEKGAYEESEAMLRSDVLNFHKPLREQDYYFTSAVTEFRQQGVYVVTDVRFGKNADTKLAASLCSLIQGEIRKLAEQ
jgi:hypothetical protein